MGRVGTLLPASPISTGGNFLESRWRTLGQILSDPVNEELFGGLSRPAPCCVVKIANVLWLLFFHSCGTEKWNQMICKRKKKSTIKNV